MHPALILLLLTLTLSPQRATADERPDTCTYTTYRWRNGGEPVSPSLPKEGAGGWSMHPNERHP